jgi:hypothetical protein
MALRVADIAKFTLNVLNNADPRIALFFGPLVLNPCSLLASLDEWYTVHVSAYLKAFVLDEQTFACSVVLYVPAKFKVK